MKKLLTTVITIFCLINIKTYSQEARSSSTLDSLDAVLNTATINRHKAKAALKSLKMLPKSSLTPQQIERIGELELASRNASVERRNIIVLINREEARLDSRSFDFANLDEDYVNGSKIEFFGSGAIQRAVTDQGELPANVGIGVMYDRIFRRPTYLMGIRRMEVAININVASTVDTLVANYNPTINAVTNIRELGSAILLPVNSGRAAGAFARLYFDPTSRFYNPGTVLNVSGIQARLVGSSRVWRLDSLNTATQQNEGYELIGSTLSGRIGLFYEFFPNTPELRKDLSISLGLDYSWRWMFSDLGRTKNPERIMLLNGSKKHAYQGVEPYISIRLKNIRAEVSIPVMFARPESSIRGLTGAQFVTSISFVGGFPVKIDRDRRSTPAP